MVQVPNIKISGYQKDMFASLVNYATTEKVDTNRIVLNKNKASYNINNVFENFEVKIDDIEAKYEKIRKLEMSKVKEAVKNNVIHPVVTFIRKYANKESVENYDIDKFLDMAGPTVLKEINSKKSEMYDRKSKIVAVYEMPGIVDNKIVPGGYSNLILAPSKTSFGRVGSENIFDTGVLENLENLNTKKLQIASGHDIGIEYMQEYERMGNFDLPNKPF